MKYEQLKEISAEELIKDKPCAEEFSRYLKYVGYCKINYIDNQAGFDNFIQNAKDFGWINWLKEYKYIREVEEEIKAKVEVFYYTGQEFKHDDRDGDKQFLLSQVDTHKIALIGVTKDKGNRWCASVSVNNSEKITEEEFYEITGHKPQQFTLMPSCL